MTSIYLLDFPCEVLDIIFSYLSFLDSISMFLTCKTLYEQRPDVISELHSAVYSYISYTELYSLFHEAIVRDKGMRGRDHYLISFSKTKYFTCYSSLLPSQEEREGFTSPSLWYGYLCENDKSNFSMVVDCGIYPEWLSFFIYTNSKDENFVLAFLVLLINSRSKKDIYFHHSLKDSLRPQAILSHLDFLVSSIKKRPYRELSGTKDLLYHLAGKDDKFPVDYLMTLIHDERLFCASLSRLLDLYPERLTRNFLPRLSSRLHTNYYRCDYPDLECRIKSMI